MTIAATESTLKVVCSSCRASMRVRASAAGKSVACPTCRALTAIPAPVSDDGEYIACPQCSAVTQVPAGMAGAARCSSCMMPLRMAARSGPRSGLLELLPVGIAAFLLVVTGWALGVYVPVLFTGGGTVVNVIVGLAALVNGLVFFCSLGFLFRMDAGRVGLGWLLAIGAVLGVIGSLLSFSIAGGAIAALYALSSWLFLSGRGESYVAGGPPGPKTALALVVGALVVAASLALVSAFRVAAVIAKSGAFAAEIKSVDAALEPTNAAYAACLSTPKKSRTAAVESFLKECDEAEGRMRRLPVDHVSILRGRVLVMRYRVRAIGLAPAPFAPAEKIRASAIALISEVRSAVAGDDSPMASLVRTDADGVEKMLDASRH